MLSFFKDCPNIDLTRVLYPDSYAVHSFYSFYAVEEARMRTERLFFFKLRGKGTTQNIRLREVIVTASV